uniref:Uncharacterized protein n=1 Tax=Timema bartmani TaxID=61472 RepID=A0A7R9EWH0_9NEOP|nr:unnamed protein product [Timema bartmani]
MNSARKMFLSVLNGGEETKRRIKPRFPSRERNQAMRRKTRSQSPSWRRCGDQCACSKLNRHSADAEILDSDQLENT